MPRALAGALGLLTHSLRNEPKNYDLSIQKQANAFINRTNENVTRAWSWLLLKVVLFLRCFLFFFSSVFICSSAGSEGHTSGQLVQHMRAERRTLEEPHMLTSDRA
ncbi:hypothetical protein EYF80_015075 [Liparis tanakae]|uniref:Uncharacterized protein n=1 Tax=Liparis tanakae TaxID=230148 RepID=A0A4Z2I9X9_9TELE|nr:hypothetical protein EYF80_015075 [Liparis tanakae]